MIFNSLGSNYSWRFAWSFLLARRRPAASFKLQEKLAKTYQGRAWLYYRGRAALHEAVRLSGANQVLVNAFTCYAVEQAIRQAGSQVVFADVEKDSFHFSLKQLKQEHQKQPQIKAVVVQNTFGLAAEVSAIADYCRQNDIYLIEDLAHCPQGQYLDGTQFGQVADFVVLSFGRDKALDVVSGGALIVRRREMVQKVRAPRVIRRHYQQRCTDRFYPLLISLVRAAYSRRRWLGKIMHNLSLRLQLLPYASDGLLLSGYALPDYRSQFVLDQLSELATEQKRRSALSQIYAQQLFGDKFLYKNDNLLRLPVVLGSTTVRQLFLMAAKKEQFYLDDTWYDSPVYPARFSEISAYRVGLCHSKDKLHKLVLNLPLHRQVSSQQAKRLAQILKPYLDLNIQTRLSEDDYRQARQQIAKTTYCNLLTSLAEQKAWQAMGATVHRLAFYGKKELLALVSAVVIKARRGRFLKVAGNPLFRSRNPQLQKIVLQTLKHLALSEGCAFIRLQACLDDEPANHQLLRSSGFQPASSDLNAPHTLKIDLKTQSADELWSSVALRKTRSRIRRAKKNGLKVSWANDEESLEDFLSLLRQTQKRQDFIPNNFKLIKAQFQSYKEAGALKLYKAVLPASDNRPEEVLAMTFLVVDEHEIVDFYGATSAEGLKLYAAYLVKWQIILEAYKEGVKLYNLWGAAPPEADEKHHFAGFTIFKKNFGGQYFSYLPSYDYVLKKLPYNLVYLWEKYEKRRN